MTCNVTWGLLSRGNLSFSLSITAIRPYKALKMIPSSTDTKEGCKSPALLFPQNYKWIILFTRPTKSKSTAMSALLLSINYCLHTKCRVQNLKPIICPAPTLFFGNFAHQKYLVGSPQCFMTHAYMFNCFCLRCPSLKLPSCGPSSPFVFIVFFLSYFFTLSLS